MPNKNIVVYTCIFNDYDVLLQPTITPENVDYVCFTDNINTVSGIWKPRVTSYDDLSAKQATSKRKILPHRIFPEYDYSVWIDGNIRVVGDVRELLRTELQDVDLAVRTHPDRDCIYDEAVACLNRKKGDPTDITEQINRYRREGFPEGFGLSELRVILRRHNKTDVVETMERWWDEFQAGSDREQLSFEFAAWKCNLYYKYSEIDYYDRANYFNHFAHKPPGYRGQIYEMTLRGREENTGLKSKVFGWIYSFFSHIYKFINRSQS